MPLRKIRVLHIDNKQYILDMIDDLFSNAIGNLSIIKVNTKIDSIETAIDTIETGYFHIAIVDKRLTRDSDPQDESGIELANQIAQNYPWMKIVMLTSFANYLEFKNKLPQSDEYGEPIFSGYISKTAESPDKWCSKMADIIKTSLKINFDLRIQLLGVPDKEPEQLLIETVFKEKSIKNKDKQLIDNLSIELKDLFSKIYFDKDKIKIEPMDGQVSSGSKFVKVYHGQNLAEIISFGEREKIEIEYKNYKEYVSGCKIPLRTTIDQGKFARTKNLGAIAYKLIDTDIREIENFSKYYHKNDTKTIVSFLENFLKENWKMWSTKPQSGSPKDVVEEYKRYFKFSILPIKHEIKRKLSESGKQHIIRMDDFGLRFDDPIYSAQHSFFKPLVTKRCLIHGDLNSKNILVYHNIGWLIDFFSTGWGHCLRDFIKLETDMKFMFTKEFDLASLIRLEKALLARDNFEEESDIQNFDDEEALKKLFICIKHLRKLAVELTNPKSIGEYYVGLFFTTLRTLQFYKVEGFTKSQDKKRLKFAFISAGLIHEKLKDMGLVSSAPPYDSGNGESGETSLQPREISITNGSTFNVFISHSSKDKMTVLDIIQKFKRKGISYWVDHEQIEFGDVITGKIEDGLKNSKYTLVVLSKNLGKSNWCQKEYGPILHREYNGKSGKKVIPLRLDDCDDDDIPPLLYDKKRAHYSNKEEFEELLDYLKK